MRKGNPRGLLHPCRLLHDQFQMNEREAFHSWSQFCADRGETYLTGIIEVVDIIFSFTLK